MKIRCSQNMNWRCEPTRQLYKRQAFQPETNKGVKVYGKIIVPKLRLRKRILWHWLGCPSEAVFFSSVFFLVGGGFFLAFVLAVVSVCACHVYKSQSASHSPFFHLLATLLPSPEQARPIVWGREMPSIPSPFHWGGGWLINASRLGNISQLLT